RISEELRSKREVRDPQNHRESQIRMVAGLTELIEGKDSLVAEACNHPNCLVLPFRMELIRLVA
ncbi:MAG: hypothetical protein WBC57_24190, partial [Candidatus Acidiferrales bacterium]